MDKDGTETLRGMSEMLHYLKVAQQYERLGEELVVPLLVHPFNLNPLLQQNSAASLLWGESGTDRSCVLMAQRISGLVKVRHTQCAMRIIKAVQPTSDAGTAPRHNYYFEFATELYACLVGHCNDFSGGGLAGTYAIRAMFLAVAEMTGQPTEEVVISAGQEKAALDRIERETRAVS